MRRLLHYNALRCLRQASSLHGLQHGDTKLSGRLGDVDASIAHGSNLGLGVALATRNDGASVAWYAVVVVR